MDALKKKTYYIPPKLNRSYLLAGFTIIELIMFVAAFFLAGYMALHGNAVLMIFPAAILVLNCRALPDGKNVKQALVMRWRYFKKEQGYGLQECDRKR